MRSVGGMAPYTLVVHGGAGVIDAAVRRHGEAAYLDTLREALDAGGRLLGQGSSALDAVEAAVRVLEDSPLFNAGRGSVFCADGTHAMEASLQDGRTRGAGAVIGLRTTRYPVSGARAVMERTPHVTLFDCDAWLLEQGLEQKPAAWFDVAERQEQLEAAKAADAVRLDHADDDAAVGGGRMGTVGAVALDARGGLAAATSTGGMTNKMAGRVGDSPVIGAGTHACAACAVSCTGKGEAFLRHAVAASIGTRVAACGASLHDACDALVHGVLARGDGGVIGVDARGEVAMPFSTRGMFRGVLREGSPPCVAVWADDAQSQRSRL